MKTIIKLYERFGRDSKCPANIPCAPTHIVVPSFTGTSWPSDNRI